MLIESCRKLYRRCSSLRNPTRAFHRFPDEEIDDYVEKREFRELALDDYQDIYKEDPSGKSKEIIEQALSEYEFIKYNSNGRVPSDLTVDDMRFIIDEGDSPTVRERLFNYFFKREMSRRSLERKKSIEKEETKRRLIDKAVKITKLVGKHERTGLLSEDGHIIYGLWHNSLFPRLNHHREMIRFTGNALTRAALLGRKLIFDFSYEDYMRKSSIRGICEQVQSAYGLNRFSYDTPFDLWFCNLEETSYSYNLIKKNYLPNLDTNSMISIKSGSPTDYFDRDQLVYLSPNSKTKLTDIQHSDDIYIIGAYNDKGYSLPLSLKKAEEMRIRSASLPLDEHLAWKGPSKNLCVNHVAGILLELMHNGNDWKSAFAKYIPTRKVKTIEEIQQEELYRAEKYGKFKKTNIMKFFHS